jgi:cadmium resistance protein CadD (predicted permease)
MWTCVIGGKYIQVACVIMGMCVCSEKEAAGGCFEWIGTCLHYVFQDCSDPLVLEVVIFALIFGVDNIAIYLCLFANMDYGEVAASVIMFYLLLAILVAISFAILFQVSFLCALAMMHQDRPHHFRYYTQQAPDRPTGARNCRYILLHLARFN